MSTTFIDNDIMSPGSHRFTLCEIVEGFGLELWDTDRPYPIFDEDYRETLNNRIYDHFKYRRIAASTPQQFVFFLNRRMRENMPAYNEIYKRLSAEDFDPYLTSEGASGDNMRTNTKSNTTAKNSADSTSNGTTITSDTPASFLEQAEDPKYMSSLVQAKTTGKNTGDSTSDTISGSEGSNESRYVGRAGYLGDNIINSLATGFLNTDKMVCDMLEPLFIQLWDDQPL